MNRINALLFSIAIVLAAIFLGNAYSSRSDVEGVVSVTGLGSEEFVSDLIVWTGSFSSFSSNLEIAYDKLSQERTVIEKYLLSKGVKPDELVFTAINTSDRNRSNYENGKFVGNTFEGYDLSQSIRVESANVNGIEKIAREVTELLRQGVQFYSSAPRYYYTGLADLKIEMISKATEDARVRAETIAENSGGKLSKLRSARMGVFQITGKNSNEDYSWGGAYNTSSKIKNASITMRLEYAVK